MYRLLAASLVVALTNMSSAAAQAQHDPPGGSGTDGRVPQASSFIRVLNALGEQGWELVTQESREVPCGHSCCWRS